jgi:hypothetical protein
MDASDRGLEEIRLTGQLQTAAKLDVPSAADGVGEHGVYANK